MISTGSKSNGIQTLQGAIHKYSLVDKATEFWSLVQVHYEHHHVHSSVGNQLSLTFRRQISPGHYWLRPSSGNTTQTDIISLIDGYVGRDFHYPRGNWKTQLGITLWNNRNQNGWVTTVQMSPITHYTNINISLSLSVNHSHSITSEIQRHI